MFVLYMCELPLHQQFQDFMHGEYMYLLSVGLGGGVTWPELCTK